MVYIKLEENMDKFLSKYENLPRAMKKMLFQSKCRKGKFEIQKKNMIECIVLPEVNGNVLKKLGFLASIRCWKNICVSYNLADNEKFLHFANENNLKIMDGKWLFKNIIEQVVEYVVESKNEVLGNQEVAILCNNLDETTAEKIKEISKKTRVCNVLSKNLKQYQKLEKEVYETNGIILNLSNNYKKAILKSSLVINFDFSQQGLEKCAISKKAYIINLGQDIALNKKEWNGREIAFYAVNMPTKYCEYQEIFEGFNPTILYESLIYKNTSYKNIQKELLEDDIQVQYLVDSNGKFLKKQDFILPKTLDKIAN